MSWPMYQGQDKIPPTLRNVEIRRHCIYASQQYIRMQLLEVEQSRTPEICPMHFTNLKCWQPIKNNKQVNLNSRTPASHFENTLNVLQFNPILSLTCNRLQQERYNCKYFYHIHTFLRSNINNIYHLISICLHYGSLKFRH